MKTVSVMKYLKSTPGTHRYENRDDPHCTSVYVKKLNRANPKMWAVVTIEDTDEEPPDDSKIE